MPKCQGFHPRNDQLLLGFFQPPGSRGMAASFIPNVPTWFRPCNSEGPVVPGPGKTCPVNGVDISIWSIANMLCINIEYIYIHVCMRMYIYIHIILYYIIYIHAYIYCICIYVDKSKCVSMGWILKPRIIPSSDIDYMRIMRNSVSRGVDSP